MASERSHEAPLRIIHSVIGNNIHSEKVLAKVRNNLWHTINKSRTILSLQMLLSYKNWKLYHMVKCVCFLILEEKIQTVSSYFLQLEMLIIFVKQDRCERTILSRQSHLNFLNYSQPTVWLWDKHSCGIFFDDS